MPAPLPLVLRALADSFPGPDSAADFCHWIAVGLGQAGYSVRREVRVPDRGDGRAGRLDIVAQAQPDGKQYAVELDNILPRVKSAFKVAKSGGGFIVTRTRRIYAVSPDLPPAPRPLD